MSEARNNETVTSDAQIKTAIDALDKALLQLRFAEAAKALDDDRHTTERYNSAMVILDQFMTDHRKSP